MTDLRVSSRTSRSRERPDCNGHRVPRLLWGRFFPQNVPATPRSNRTGVSEDVLSHLLHGPYVIIELARLVHGPQNRERLIVDANRSVFRFMGIIIPRILFRRNKTGVLYRVPFAYLLESLRNNDLAAATARIKISSPGQVSSLITMPFHRLTGGPTRHTGQVGPGSLASYPEAASSTTA